MADSRLYGLIGGSLEHSFSAAYFNSKFEKENINASYENFEVAKTSDIKALFKDQKNLSGLNVTFPYKEDIIPYLDELSEDAKEISAVNVIEFKKGLKIGHNTDAPAFAQSLSEVIPSLKDRTALILGYGGASRAIEYALNKLDLKTQLVSRKTLHKIDVIDYKQLKESGMHQYGLIVNCTPLGTYPHIETMVDIPYDQLSIQHFMYDLVYNPEVSSFLKEGLKKGIRTKNGSEMLKLQAELSWQIWNRKE